MMSLSRASLSFMLGLYYQTIIRAVCALLIVCLCLPAHRAYDFNLKSQQPCAPLPPKLRSTKSKRTCKETRSENLQAHLGLVLEGPY